MSERNEALDLQEISVGDRTIAIPDVSKNPWPASTILTPEVRPGDDAVPAAPPSPGGWVEIATLATPPIARCC